MILSWLSFYAGDPARNDHTGTPFIAPWGERPALITENRGGTFRETANP
jgi:hypothetical protein